MIFKGFISNIRLLIQEVQNYRLIQSVKYLLCGNYDAYACVKLFGIPFVRRDHVYLQAELLDLRKLRLDKSPERHQDIGVIIAHRM